MNSFAGWVELSWVEQAGKSRRRGFLEEGKSKNEYVYENGTETIIRFPAPPRGEGRRGRLALALVWIKSFS